MGSVNKKCLIKSSFFLMLISIGFGLVTPVMADRKEDLRKEELRKKIEKLEMERSKLREKAVKQQEDSKISGNNLVEVITRYEKLLEGCQIKKSGRCADVMFTLGGLYFDQEREAYVAMREEYEKKMDAYEKSPRGPEPVNPVPNYKKPLNMYERLSKEYPDFSRSDEAYYQTGYIYLQLGDIDRSIEAFKLVITKAPNSPRASGAYFRLAEYAYINGDHAEAIKYLERIKETEIDIQTAEMVHYRKAEIYYNMSEFDKSINLFYTYVEKCDAGQYQKREFRDMALEFMAVSFSDMGDGAKEAISFFKKVGSKSYEPYIMYTIGMKNRTHGQFDDAIIALGTALDKFPFYKDAPVARQMLIECYVVKKEHEKANKEREALVDDYGTQGQWYAKNRNQTAVIEQSINEMKKALSSIAVYNHALAQKSKGKTLYEKALQRYNEFFTKFSDDKWRVFEFKYNVAEIYSTLGDCEKAAENYDFVAMENLAAYPEYKSIVDTLGMDQEEIEKQKRGVKSNPVAISQEDAGWNVIVALDNCRKKAIAKSGISEDNAYDIQETKKLLAYTEKFQSKFSKSSNAPEVLYIAGNIHYVAKSYDNAIRVFKQITTQYPDSKVSEKSLRMLANSYSSSGQFDLAMSMYRQLLSKQSPNTPEYAEILDLAAGAMFKRAESIKTSGNVSQAAETFKAIFTEYPSSKVADRGWFEAGVCYEELKKYDVAAATFENLPAKFVKSTLKESAFLRAADNYKKIEQWENAARVYLAGAKAIPKAEFAIPSLSSASECYQKLNKFDMAGKMFELIYENYSNDPKTPQALYNAGLIFEKGKLYTNAISVYNVLATRFSQSEYAAEAFFSIGLCYEKMGNNLEMAKVFSDYAQKYGQDRFKQVQALVKAGDAYFNMRKNQEATDNYNLAVSIYEKYHKNSDIDIGSIAAAYFKLGEVSYSKFEKISLITKSEKDLKNLIKDKTKALEEPSRFFAKAIELGVEEWTLKSTYMISQGFIDMAEAVRNQTLFGSADQKIASKIRVISSLDKYYERAQEYLFKNIEWAHTQNIKGEHVDKSVEKFCELSFKRGYLFEEVGLTFKNAPIPRDLASDEKEAYRQLLEEKLLESMDAALPKYEEGLRGAAQLKLGENQWVAKMKERIEEINPSSEILALRVEKWNPQQGTTPLAVSNPDPQKPKKEISDSDYERSMRRIQNIMSMEINVSDRVKQLNRIEMDAKRNIVLEQERIRELKAQSGS